MEDEVLTEDPQSRNEALLQNILGDDNTITEPQSRNEAILYAMGTGATEIGEPYTAPPQSRIEALLIDVFEKSGDLWDAASKTLNNTQQERYGVTLDGGHTYVIVNNSSSAFGGDRDSRTCYWWDKTAGTTGQLLASDGRTQAAVVTSTGELHIWVGTEPSPYFHVYRFDM